MSTSDPSQSEDDAADAAATTVAAPEVLHISWQLVSALMLADSGSSPDGTTMVGTVDPQTAALPVPGS